MATRSTIAIEAADGTVKQIYCHWDGYLDHNGKLLITHYKDAAKAEQLIALGSISSLRRDVGEKHDFNNADDAREKGWTTAYHRDRGEDLSVNEFKSFDDYRANHQYEEYEYILRNTGEWFVAAYGEKYVPLAEAIAAEMLDAEMEVDE